MKPPNTTQVASGNKSTRFSNNVLITGIGKYSKTTSENFNSASVFWSIENKLHYKLDVGLHEDDCQIYRGNADQNLAAMRKLALALLEKETSSKDGIALKRYKAALSTRYLRKVINL